LIAIIKLAFGAYSMCRQPHSKYTAYRIILVLLTIIIIGYDGSDAGTPLAWAALAHHRCAGSDFLLELGALNDIGNQGIEGLLHIYSVLGRGLQVYQVEARCHFFGFLLENQALIVFKVVLIPQKDNFYVGIGNLSDLAKPVGYIFKT
jgi:hypothetical protein